MSYPKNQIDKKAQRERERQREDFALVLTGRRHQRRFLVYVWGEPVWLPGSLIEVLADLVAAAAESGAGYVDAGPVTIHRLRHAIDAALAEPGTGARLIASAGNQYRLIVPATSVALDPTFGQLAACGLLGRAQVEHLLGSYRIVIEL